MYEWTLGILSKAVGDVEIKSLDQAALRAFFTALPANDPPLSARSIQIIHIQIGAFFKWLVSEGWISARPDANIKVPRAPDPLVQPFTEDEVRRMLKSSMHVVVQGEKRNGYSYRRRFAERNRAILLVLLCTGVRAGELCALNMGDVDYIDTGAVMVRAQKTPFPRTTYLDNAARKALWKYLAVRGEPRSNEPLFLSDDGDRMTSHSLYALIKNIGDRAHVENAHPHRWRHTFAVQWIRNGGDVARLRIIMGHQSITVTQRYLQMAQPDIQSAHAASSAGDRWRL